MSAAAQQVHIAFMGSTAMREALEALVPLYEQASGHKVGVTLHPASVVVAKIREAARLDLVMTSPANIDTLVKEGKLVADSRVDFVHSRVGVAVRAGAPKPDIGTEEAFMAALFAARSVAISQGPSGVHFMQAMQRLGVADVIRAKAVIPDISVRIGTVVARGDAEIGIQQIGELLPMPGIDYVGPLPDELQSIIVYATALPAGAKERAAAEALVKFLTSPQAAPILKKLGLDPA